jgi:hypothetical protein
MARDPKGIETTGFQKMFSGTHEGKTAEGPDRDSRKGRRFVVKDS